MLIYIYIYVAGDYRYLLIYLHGEVVKLRRNTLKVIILINLRPETWLLIERKKSQINYVNICISSYYTLIDWV